MKKKLFLYPIIMLMLLTSCHTSTSLFIQGTPNSEVYSNGLINQRVRLQDKWDLTYPPNYNNYSINIPIGHINNEGYLKIKKDDHAYIGLGLTRNENGTIPFAFDYKRKKAHVLNSILSWTTGIIFPLWILDVPQVFICIGSQDAYEYHYKYKKNQTTNQDLTFTFPDIMLLDPPQNTMNNEPTSSNKNNHPNIDVSQNNSGVISKNDNTTQSNGIKSQKKLKKTTNTKDLAQDITGDFVGSGSLMKKGKVIESYNGISVTIRHVDINIVGINVIEKDGTAFFSSDILYTVQINDDESYTLKEMSDSNQTINISKVGIMQFEHKKVNIEDELYNLIIIARKKN